MSGTIDEATFIYLGLTKDKWPHLSVQTIRDYLSDPSQLDDGSEPFNERFFFYYDWYWRNQRE